MSDSVRPPWTVSLLCPWFLCRGILLYPSPRDFPNRGIKLASLKSPALAVSSLPLVPPGKPIFQYILELKEMFLDSKLETNSCLRINLHPYTFSPEVSKHMLIHQALAVGPRLLLPVLACFSDILQCLSV